MPVSSIICKSHPKAPCGLCPANTPGTFVPTPRSTLPSSACLKQQPWGPFLRCLSLLQPPARLPGATSPGTPCRHRPLRAPAPTMCSRGRRAAWPLRGPVTPARSATGACLGFKPRRAAPEHPACSEAARKPNASGKPTSRLTSGCPATPRPPALMESSFQEASSTIALSGVSAP